MGADKLRVTSYFKNYFHAPLTLSCHLDDISSREILPTLNTKPDTFAPSLTSPQKYEGSRPYGQGLKTNFASNTTNRNPTALITSSSKVSMRVDLHRNTVYFRSYQEACRPRPSAETRPKIVRIDITRQHHRRVQNILQHFIERYWEK